MDFLTGADLETGMLFQEKAMALNASKLYITISNKESLWEKKDKKNL